MPDVAMIERAVPASALRAVETADFGNGVVLSVSPFEDDHTSLEQIVSELRFKINRALTLTSALDFLARGETTVLICERDLAGGSWKDLLSAVSASPYQPPVVVASHLADELLWIEALTAGAYDVVAKPYYPTEVIRIVSLASRRCHDTNRCGNSPLAERRTGRFAA
jgi:DNA-binding response OmpR family regulator